MKKCFSLILSVVMLIAAIFVPMSVSATEPTNLLDGATITTVRDPAILTLEEGVISSSQLAWDVATLNLDLDFDGSYRYEVNIKLPSDPYGNGTEGFFIPFRGNAPSDCLAVFFYPGGVSIAKMATNNVVANGVVVNGEVKDYFYQKTRNVGQEYNVVIESHLGSASVIIDGFPIFDNVALPEYPAMFGIGTKNLPVTAELVSLTEYVEEQEPVIEGNLISKSTPIVSTIRTPMQMVREANGLIRVDKKDCWDTAMLDVELDPKGSYRYEVNIMQPWQSSYGDSYSIYVPFRGTGESCLAVYFFKGNIFINNMKYNIPNDLKDADGNAVYYYSNMGGKYTFTFGKVYNVVVESHYGSATVIVDGVKIFDNIQLPEMDAAFGVGERNVSLAAMPVSLTALTEDEEEDDEEIITGENLITSSTTVANQSGEPIITYSNGVASCPDTDLNDVMLFDLALDAKASYRYMLNVKTPQIVGKNKEAFYIPFRGKMGKFYGLYFWEAGHVSILGMVNSYTYFDLLNENGGKYDYFYPYAVTREAGKEYNVVIESHYDSVTVIIDGVTIFDNVALPEMDNACFGVGTRASSVEASDFSLVKMAEPVVSGDANGNGETDVLDLIRVKKYIAGLDVTVSEAAADLDADGDIDGEDLVLIVKTILGIPTSADVANGSADTI
ncbi:MAG: hypothetical protein IKD04_09390 [Clostridia bacterium]|nr:hypothetical protein [Clostridia bacterium]